MLVVRFNYLALGCSCAVAASHMSIHPCAIGSRSDYIVSPASGKREFIVCRLSTWILRCSRPTFWRGRSWCRPHELLRGAGLKAWRCPLRRGWRVWSRELCSRLLEGLWRRHRCEFVHGAVACCQGGSRGNGSGGHGSWARNTWGHGDRGNYTCGSHKSPRRICWICRVSRVGRCQQHARDVVARRQLRTFSFRAVCD